MRVTSFNSWIGENALRLMQTLSISAPLDEDAFQDAYLSLATSCRKQEAGSVFEKAFLMAYRKFSRKAMSEAFNTYHPDDIFFTLLPAQETECNEQNREQEKESLTHAIKAYISTTFNRAEVAVWEMRMSGTSIRDITDALGLSRAATDNTMRRITELTCEQFAYTI